MLASTFQRKERIAESELVLNPDGSVYHIKLLPEMVADTVIVVGDQGRVERISRHFDRVDHRIANREFVTHTGTFNGKDLTVLSTGIGTDNIDIVLNELDAAVNIDLDTRVVKEQLRSLNIIRLGTSGALQEDIPVDEYVVSTHGLGFDGVMHFYAHTREDGENELLKALNEQLSWPDQANPLYLVEGNQELIDRIGHGAHRGITATANGFYGPQGRVLRLAATVPDLNERMRNFSFSGHRITNFEMETSALYGLSAIMGHKACTICAIIANRFAKKYSDDHHAAVDSLIDHVLQRSTMDC